MRHRRHLAQGMARAVECGHGQGGAGLAQLHLGVNPTGEILALP